MESDFRIVAVGSIGSIGSIASRMALVVSVECVRLGVERGQVDGGVAARRGTVEPPSSLRVLENGRQSLSCSSRSAYAFFHGSLRDRGQMRHHVVLLFLEQRQRFRYTDRRGTNVLMLMG